jgi:hypothetical protein
MDTYYRKTRRPIANLSTSLKRPPQKSAPPPPPSAAKSRSPTKTPVPSSIAKSQTPTKTPASPPRPIARPLFPTKTPSTPPPSIAKPLSPAKTPSTPPPSIAKPLSPTKTPPPPTTGPDSPPQTPPRRICRPAQPPPIKRKRADLPENRKRPLTVRELFKTVHPLQEDKEETQVQSPSKIASGPLKGISTSLLDLIRAKEAKAKESPEQVRQRELLGIAPDIARIVPTVFTAHKRDIMSYDKVVEKCFKALRSNYSTSTIIECLDLMDKVAPEWVTIVQISRGKFMRINKDKYTLPQLMEAIRRYTRI